MLAPEMWGGVECTVNRVHDGWHDQLRASGHDTRIEDLARFAQLGLKRLRYPALWETTAPDAPDRFDWRWLDQRLARLQALSLDPILGLLHHGSGPRYTNLLDGHFPQLFAQYATAVARRFPWVTHYTPVNEPLTTARFSALYGHWYPHSRDDRSFARALVNQVRATTLAMQAIRRVNSSAQLVQTDDLGRTTSTPKLIYQADFDNERRWLGWDLLRGDVNRQHAMWGYLCKAGIAAGELDWLVDHPCPPDIVGINHYVTSDRYLDDDISRHAPETRGGNGRDAYADIAAVRAADSQAAGIAGALDDVWTRYRCPMAITEAHLGCTREDQLRWLHRVWRAAQEARTAGLDVRAVTAWALLGSFDWDSLVTRVQRHYEAGAFDVRGPAPRETAIAHLISDLASHRTPRRSAIVAEPGWWERDCRSAARRHSAVPLLVTGASGTLGRAFTRLCEMRGLHVRAYTRAELDICDAASIDRALDETSAWAVINTAGYVRVDDAERDCERCYRENSRGAELLASACAARSLPLLTFSSDLVFDGQRQTPYVETNDVRPLNVYGLSKARAERAVMQAHPSALVVRTSAFFGPWDEHNFVTIALRTLARGEVFRAIDDIVVSPTYVPDLVNASLDLLIDGERGLWHLVNDGGLTWAELARHAARVAKVSTRQLRPDSWRTFDLAARRPSFSVLASERGVVMPNLHDALARYVAAK
ncbi:MAG TPA: family 1 glycosylhydrolase [Steroidobacteraceae bacterium]|nr:family 1 glycosylhydrolase [Steroidobacteraceae bacterium]